MKENKKKILFIIIPIVVVIVLIIALVLTFSNKESIFTPAEVLEFPEDAVEVTASLENNSQETIDKTIQEDLLNNKYTLENAKVYVDPYESSPLSALITFYTSDVLGNVEVTVKGKYNNDLVTSYEAQDYNYIPVYGLYPNYENTVEIKYNGKTQTFKITTEILNFDYDGSIKYNNNKVGNDNFYFVTSPIEMASFAVDSFGDIRWYSIYYHDIQVLENNHLLIGGSLSGFALSSTISEIDYLGRVYSSYDISSGFLNAFYLKDDGNIIIPSSNDERDTISDYIIEVDTNTGKIVKTIDVYKLFEEIDPDFTKNLDEYYFFNSGIDYDKDTNTLLLTYWDADFVISIDYEKETINWIFSDPSNFTSKFDSYLLKGNITYPKSMHSASLDGNVLKVFDNGYNAYNEVTSIKALAGSYSSANTYKIDGKNISLVRTYDENKELFSYALADYNVLSSNDEIVLFGRELENVDYNTETNINEYYNLSSRLIEYIDSEKVLDLKLNFAALTVDKVNVTKGDDFNFNPIKNLNSSTPSKKEEITNDTIEQIKNADMTLDYEIGLSSDTLQVNMSYVSFYEAKVVLINTYGQGGIYNLKLKDKMLNEDIVIDLEKGRYYIYIEENGKMYKTDKYIEIA